MNSHKNKHKPAKKVPQNLGVVEVDGLPQEVAKSMLMTPGTKLSNPMRKNCMRAVSTYFTSTREPRSFITKFQVRAHRASSAQLLKWAKRTTRDRMRVTKAWLVLRGKRALLDPKKVHDIAKAERAMAACDIEAERLDYWMAALRGEAQHRLIAGKVFELVA